ncbi:prolyl oligopeptidase [Chitinophaga skermanii]|uniref:prolyl oligopeptidase n=2 Tax=Chitinophaga skermanii TaxID=331697 RepID=A0A327QMI7_9BACT|nr:prolyl oligopeptidase [Chitinophaga skermanii]
MLGKYHIKYFLGITMASMMTGNLMAQKPLVYPSTAKVDTIDHYFGKDIADPYRWLEDDNSEATKAWVIAQNKVTDAYLADIPYRDKIKARLSELLNFPRYSNPWRKGKYYYFFKNNGLQNQNVMYRQVGLDGTPEVYFDPNTLSADGTMALSGISFTKDGKYCVYSVAKSGSDWQEYFIMDAETKQLLPEKLEWIKFSGVAYKGHGFYYSRYDAPSEAQALSGKNEFHKLYYHKIGTPQSDDQLVFVDKDHPLRNVYGATTEDERFLVLNLSEGTSGAELYYKDLQNPSQSSFQLLVPGFKYDPSVVDNVGDHLLVYTNEDAPNYKLISIDTKNSAKAAWKTVIPEAKETLSGVQMSGGKLFANYMKDAISEVLQYDINGKLERKIDFPGVGTVSGFGGEKEDKTLFYTFTSYIAPATVYKYNVASGKSDIYHQPEVKFNPNDYESKIEFFHSKDGTRVPVFISYKKGIKKDGNNPLMLYGYGGFNISLTPAFSTSNLFFMEQGGIYVVVGLRGGGEYGEAWHQAGMLGKKQNVFDDFIGAAEYLIKEKYTNANKIAIRGGSNGGLLVGACMTQRPDLFKVAIPQVGVLDMLRYQKFTIGWAWKVEYGSSENEEQFNYLIKYSPLHNLKKGTKYPATLITTADHDDRVVPAHSFKFAAALQVANDGTNPVLIRIESKAGHGAGKPVSKVIEESADIWGFTMYNLGMTMK